MQLTTYIRSSYSSIIGLKEYHTDENIRITEMKHVLKIQTVFQIYLAYNYTEQLTHKFATVTIIEFLYVVNEKLFYVAIINTD